MITVAILINGNPIMARSATNSGEMDEQNRFRYDVDDGSVIWHAREAGATALAIELLKTLKDKVKA